MVHTILARKRLVTRLKKVPSVFYQTKEGARPVPVHGRKRHGHASETLVSISEKERRPKPIQTTYEGTK